MIKKTLCFTTAAYLSLRNKQMVIRLPEVDKSDMPQHTKDDAVVTRPIEDIGFVILDNKQITITSGLLSALLENECAVVSCDENCMPTGLMLPLDGHTLQSERFRSQVDASLPLKKQLWQQTIVAKIHNQAAVLKNHRDAIVGNMQAWEKEVRSGDANNLEGRAAAYYWKNMFPSLPEFTRGREGVPPNNLLNYGYAILRATVARGLVVSGLLPTLGIHHHNRYNAYCLADDIMEPYRPYVDEIVLQIVDGAEDYSKLTKELKQRFWKIPDLEVSIDGKRSPLMVAVGLTTASLAKCFAGEIRKIVYPEMTI